jgi:hypothetical protein
MVFTEPSPLTWTLRFKHGKTTVLLYVDPLHTFSTIKSHLYTALQETGLQSPDTKQEIPLPDSPSDIQLGVPVNPSEPHRGFQLGEWEYPALDEDGGEVDGKGKGKMKGKGKKDNAAPGNVKDCPKGAGLKDGAVLAFRWRGDGTEWEDEEGDDGVEMESGRSKKGDMWGVRLASFEDAYGVENEGDLGGGREFEG